MSWGERLGGGNSAHAASRHAQRDAIGDLGQRENKVASRNQRQAVQGETMEIDWPLTTFTTLGLLAATLACRLLVHTGKICVGAIRTALSYRNCGGRTSPNNSTISRDQRSSS